MNHRMPGLSASRGYSFVDPGKTPPLRLERWNPKR